MNIKNDIEKDDVLLQKLSILENQTKDVPIKRTSKSLFNLLTKKRFSTEDNKRQPNQ